MCCISTCSVPLDMVSCPRTLTEKYQKLSIFKCKSLFLFKFISLLGFLFSNIYITLPSSLYLSNSGVVSLSPEKRAAGLANFLWLGSTLTGTLQMGNTQQPCNWIKFTGKQIEKSSTPTIHLSILRSWDRSEC